MANPIKYNTSAETLALKKGNFYIGTGDVGKGPTSSTGYYNGVTPPSGGYTIYLNKASDGPAIYTASNEAQLTSLTNRIAGTNYTTSGECLNYFATQTDKMIFNRDYSPIITNGLVLNMDAGFTPSYPTTGTNWYSISSGGSTGTLINGPTFNPLNSGSISFDGSNDYVELPNNIVSGLNGLTYGVWVYVTSLNNGSAYPGYIGAVVNNNAANNINLGIWISSIYQHIEVSTTAQQNQAYEGSIPVPVQKWYYASMTWDGVYLTEYVNGIKGKQVSTVGTTLSTTTYFGLGQHGGNIYYFNGLISNVQIYNRALLQSEILQNFFSSALIVRNGLVLNLEAGNPTSYFSGSKSWVDTAGGTIGALTNGPTFSSSGASSNIVFDGADDAVIWNSNPLSSLTSAKTYELWVKFDSSLVNTFTISCGTYMVYLEAKNTWYVNQAGASNAYLSWTFSTGWTHFIYSFDGTNHICYINGVARTINFGSGVSSQTNLYIGNRVNMDSPMKGNIAITRMYNRGLSVTEILQNFNAQRSAFGL